MTGTAQPPISGNPATGAEVVALSPEAHARHFASLGKDMFDVLVVGGGIVGAGAALDAATRGLKVAIVEAQDWASGTSSRSSKLVHGGLRYLQMYDFALVREALRERAVLLRTAPHLVRPLPIIYPLRHRALERAYVTAGIFLYDMLARAAKEGPRLPSHRQLSRQKVRELAPSLDPRRFIGAVQYYDGQVDDARHTLAVLRTAASHGAVVVSRARVTGLLQGQGRINGAKLANAETGAEVQARAKVVVSATGVWTEQFEALAGRASTLRLQPSKGVHLVVPKGRIHASTALILPTEKSVLFVLPWGEHWVIGTTDTTWEHDLARPTATAADIDYLLSTVNTALVSPLARSDIESVYVGLRPLIAGAGEETTKLSREHAVNRAMPGLVLISGGKYTTYRVMAKDVIDAAVEHAHLRAGPCSTASVPIVGAEGFSEMAGRARALAAETGLAPGQIGRLLARYGALVPEVLAEATDDASLLQQLTAAGGYIGAEVAYAVTHEDARHLEDVMERRTRISIETKDRGVEAASQVARIMAPLLGWDKATAGSELEAYRDLVAAELSAENEPDDASALERLAQVQPLLPLP
ncbi:MAG: glycerol-3-phosphate dehydrogenase/oxidase [Acidimicrobiales bacterium]